MLKTYTWPRYASRRAPELDSGPRRLPLVVVGAGPVGLCAAIDAAQRGQPVVLLDEDNTVSIGSRAVCHAKRTLDIFDGLGIGAAVVAKGVTWNVGRTFHGEREVFSFDLLPEPGHCRPGMVNLQQYHVEQLLVERAQQLPNIDLRWQHKVVGIAQDAHDARDTRDTQGATVQVDTPEGRYSLHADWLLAADGARSPIRRMLGLDTAGHAFQDRFLIADVVLKPEPEARDTGGAGDAGNTAGARNERRFWFHPPFHPEHSALMHRQADSVWRIDFQLGPQADAELEKQPERVLPRIRALLDGLGLPHTGFELEWVSVYTFQCRRLADFRHGRVLFVGDAAHQVSPFGARGGNSGVQDADNLVWKLDLVLRGLAPAALLDSYCIERGQAADENILQSTRSTDFMTPKSHASRVLRQAVLTLAAELPQAQNFARALVNSGRLSVATAYDADGALNTPNGDAPFDGWMAPGAPADDAPLPDGGWLLQALPAGFTLLLFTDAADSPHAADAPDAAQADATSGLAHDRIAVQTLPLPATGLAAQRYGARPGTAVLLRPDRHVAARWRAFDAAAVRRAVARATAQESIA